MTAWYFKLMGDEHGPMSLEELQSHAEAGRIMPDTFVRCENDRWLLASQFPALSGRIQHSLADAPIVAEAVNPIARWRNPLTLMIGMILVGAIALYVLSFLAKDGPHSPHSTSDFPRIGSEVEITNGDWPGFASEDEFNKIVEYQRQGDHEASQWAFASGLITGSCTRLRQGERVYVMGISAWYGPRVKVRRKGETAEFWTSLDAVK